MAVELARGEFDRNKQLEGGDGVRGQEIPPRLSGRSMSFAMGPMNRGASHVLQVEAKQTITTSLQKVHAGLRSRVSFPVVSMDLCFTRGLLEP